MRELPDRALLAGLLADQRRRWQAGERPAVEHYLAQHPALDADAALDLVYQEVFLREQRGESVTLAEYLCRFPRYGDALRLQFEVHAAIQPDSPAAAPAPVALPGYELQEEIGRGAMGVVYRARDLRRGRTVAVKMLLPEHFLVQSALKRFLTETRAVTRLTHPNIVAVHAVGQAGDSPYLAMDLIEGPSLEAVLGHGPLPIAEAVDVLVLVAEAIDYAHRQGVIHRDLKPSNILLDPARGPVVLDFGMAKVQREGGSSLSSATRSGTVLGTPAYMPPEQTGMRKPAIGPASDVYSLGAILYALLTGRPPFVEATVLHTIRKVRAPEPPAPVRALRAEVSADLERICLKCLEKPPARRYASAWALAGALRALADADTAPTGAFLVNETTGAQVALPLGDTVLGRAADCEVSVKDPRISRRHCRFGLRGGEAELVDLDSSWGTFVNGRRVERAFLRDGDRLEIGGQTFVFRWSR